MVIGSPNYFPETHTVDKLTRRFERLLQIVEGGSKRTLFLYISYFQPRGIKSLSEEPFTSLVKINSLLSLFRQPDTYQITFIDIDFDQNKVSPLKEHNIDYIQGACRHVDRILMFNRKNIILEIKLKFKNYTVYK